MLFFYYGQDSFRANQKVRAIKNKFKEKVDPSGHNVQHLDGELISPDDFFQAVSVMGFLADKKLIIIKNIFLYFCYRAIFNSQCYIIIIKGIHRN